MATWKTQKNHYVSQFILRGFASDKNSEMIWRYDLLNSELIWIQDCIEVPISWVWFLKNWWSQEVENFLWNHFENEASKVINNINSAICYFEKHKKPDKSLKFTRKDISIFIEFLIMQLVRSIASSVYIEESKYSKESKQEILIVSNKAFRSNFLNPDWLKWFTERVRQELEKKQFNIFWIPKHKWLITSDFPIAFPNQKYWVKHPETEWWFPLTRNVVIAFWSIKDQGKIEYRYIQITPRELDYLNRDIACQATRYIFWHNRELVLKYWNMHKKIKKSFVFDNL